MAFDEERSIRFGMEAFGWRENEVGLADMQVNPKGSVTNTSGTGSLTRRQEIVFEEARDGEGGILKTTRFVVGGGESSAERNRESGSQMPHPS